MSDAGVKAVETVRAGAVEEERRSVHAEEEEEEEETVRTTTRVRASGASGLLGFDWEKADDSSTMSDAWEALGVQGSRGSGTRLGYMQEVVRRLVQHVYKQVRGPRGAGFRRRSHPPLPCARAWTCTTSS